MTLYSTTQAATALELSAARIRVIAERQGIGTKTSAGWIFTEDDLQKLRNRNRQGGRPRTKGTGTR